MDGVGEAGTLGDGEDLGGADSGLAVEDQLLVLRELLQGDAGLVMVSAFTPAGAEGDKARAQQEKFESNPLWQRLQGEVINVDDATFLASVSIQGAHSVITDLAKHYGVDPQLP